MGDTLSLLYRDASLREVAMPWLETDAMNERSMFVHDALRDRVTIAETCERHGVSRKTSHTMHCAVC